jgi:hypothetical protein
VRAVAVTTDVNLWLENRTNLLKEDGVTPLTLEAPCLLTETAAELLLQNGVTVLELES